MKPAKAGGEVSRQRGFGLLEAIVAIVILGSTGVALFAWINQNLNSATRIQQAEQRARLQLEAQGWLQKLNPAQRPSGQEQIGDALVVWQSELMEPMRDEFDYGGFVQPRWRVGLFRITARVTRADVVVEWQQLLAGWRLNGAGPVPGVERGVMLGARRSPVRGLTLLELLVTLVITSMATALIAQMMHQIARLELRLQEGGAQSQLLMVRREWLRSAFAAALPEMINRPVQFSGSRTALRLVSAEPLGLPGLGSGGMLLEMTSGPEPGRKVLKVRPEAADSAGGVVLLGWQGESGRIEYLDFDGQWRERWPVNEEAIRRPPQAVRLWMGDEAGGIFLAAIGSNQTPRPSLADWMTQ